MLVVAVSGQHNAVGVREGHPEQLRLRTSKWWPDLAPTCLSAVTGACPGNPLRSGQETLPSGRATDSSDFPSVLAPNATSASPRFSGERSDLPAASRACS